MFGIDDWRHDAVRRGPPHPTAPSTRNTQRSSSHTCPRNATTAPTKEEVGEEGVAVDPTRQRMMIAMHRRTILGGLTHLLPMGGGGKKGIDNDDGGGDDDNHHDDVLALVLCGGRQDDDDNEEGCEGAYALEDDLVGVDI